MLHPQLASKLTSVQQPPSTLAQVTLPVMQYPAKALYGKPAKVVAASSPFQQALLATALFSFPKPSARKAF
jgi:hypothetical protein